LGRFPLSAETGRLFAIAHLSHHRALPLSDDRLSASAADRHYQSLLSGLTALRRRALLLELGAALLLGLGVGLGLASVWIGVEALFYLPPAARLSLGLVVLLSAVLAPSYYLFRRLSGRLSLAGFSRHVEHRCPELGERLISALELWRHPPARRLYSADLLAATVVDADRAFGQIERRAILDPRRLMHHARFLGLVLLVGGLALTLSDDITAALHRCAHPLTPFVREPRTRIAIRPAPREVIKGEDAIIGIHFSGDRPRTARILRRESDTALWQQEELIVDGADSLTYTFPEVKRPFSYRVHADDGQSAVQHLAVIDPPSIQRLRLTYHYPAYSGLPVRLEEESGDIHSLAGTRVDLEIVASKRLASAALVLDDTLSRPARVEARRAFAHLQVDHPGHYHLELVDAKGVGSRNPIRYAIEVIADAAPQVAISDPGRDLDLPENMQVLLAVEAVDDFGIGALTLVHRINEEAEERLPLRFPPGREVNLAYLWDLSATDLLPEDRIYYRVEALDNDQVSGPKMSASREYVLRFPSLYELYEETTQAQEENLDELEALAAEGRQTGDYLEQMRRELLKEEELSWEQKKELEATLGREAERAEEVEELAQELQETVEQLEENGLSSEEILEQIAEIRELMSQVISPELREALEQVQQALENQNPTELAEALRQFNEDQRAFQERLEQTIALLEQVRTEQRLEAAVQQAADLEERQARINEELESEAASQRLQMQEGSLQRDTERLQQELEELSQEMTPFSKQTAEQLSARAGEMERRNFSGRMQEMIQKLQAVPNTEARRLGAGLEGDLGELSANMQQLQAGFIAEQKQLLASDIQRAMRDLLRLSHRQERLLDDTRSLQQPPPSDFAEEQFALMQSVGQVTEQIGAVARKTLSLERPLVATLGYALRGMQEAAQFLGQLEGRRAVQPQSTAVQHLNESVLLLRESLENLAQSRMPSSFGEAMQKMLGLSEQQSQLNQATQQAFGEGQQPGGRGRDTRAEMARLAAQQRRLMEALQELRRATRGHRGAQQRIGAIETEMKEVLGDLQRRRLEQRTLNVQQRILQRMLDASRSIHTQGFDEEKRASESGRDRAYAGPAWLPEDLGQSFDRLREAMRHAGEGPYPEEYRPLIRRYYEQLFQDAHSDAEGLQP